jgi:hypothetical protein
MVPMTDVPPFSLTVNSHRAALSWLNPGEHIVDTRVSLTASSGISGIAITFLPRRTPMPTHHNLHVSTMFAGILMAAASCLFAQGTQARPISKNEMNTINAAASRYTSQAPCRAMADATRVTRYCMTSYQAYKDCQAISDREIRRAQSIYQDVFEKAKSAMLECL